MNSYLTPNFQFVLIVSHFIFWARDWITIPFEQGKLAVVNVISHETRFETGARYRKGGISISQGEKGEKTHAVKQKSKSANRFLPSNSNPNHKLL